MAMGWIPGPFLARAMSLDVPSWRAACGRMLPLAFNPKFEETGIFATQFVRFATFTIV